MKYLRCVVLIVKSFEIDLVDATSQIIFKKNLILKIYFLEWRRN